MLYLYLYLYYVHFYICICICFHICICICISICRCLISEDKRWISEEEPFDNCDSHRWEACLCDNDKPLLCPDRSAFVKSSANKLSKSVVPIFSSFLIAQCYIISKPWLSNVLEMLCQMDPFHNITFNTKEVKIYWSPCPVAYQFLWTIWQRHWWTSGHPWTPSPCPQHA